MVGVPGGVLGGRPKKDEEKPLTEISQQGVSKKKRRLPLPVAICQQFLYSFSLSRK
jgi:hypothetical protein